MLSCWNRSDETFTITPGERVAQLIIVPVIQANFDLVDEFIPSKRGSNGFGHTGMN